MREVGGTRRVEQLVGVYHAEGGLLGELRYAYGKVRGTAHCSLCDITHGTVRRKPEWDAMVARLGLPVRLVHLDEMDADVADAVAVSGSPVVLARLDGLVEPVLTAAELDGLTGSVPAFEQALRTALERVAPGTVDAGNTPFT
jgi:hypothetical protein